MLMVFQDKKRHESEGTVLESEGTVLFESEGTVLFDSIGVRVKSVNKGRFLIGSIRNRP